MDPVVEALRNALETHNPGGSGASIAMRSAHRGFVVCVTDRSLSDRIASPCVRSGACYPTTVGIDAGADTP